MYDIDIYTYMGEQDGRIYHVHHALFLVEDLNEELKIYEDLVEDLADVTLTEDTNAILIDDGNIPNNMTSQVKPFFGQISN